VHLAACTETRGHFFAVSPADPAMLAAVAAILFGTTLLACIVSTRRAMRVDPVTFGDPLPAARQKPNARASALKLSEQSKHGHKRHTGNSRPMQLRWHPGLEP